MKKTMSAIVLAVFLSVLCFGCGASGTRETPEDETSNANREEHENVAVADDPFF
jgi:predicted small lipoprotein YifL